MPVPPPSRLLLPIIVFSQFAGTSLWFAGNAIINDIQQSAGINIANITSVVQVGFIAGTLAFSILAIADRFKASHVFFFSSLFAAVANLMLVWMAQDTGSLLLLRLITGFFLAGIYPVGMKIASDCFPGKLGNALGFLVGALVLGTAFPHLLRSQMELLNWEDVIISTSALAFTGGSLILLVIPSNPERTNHPALKWNTAFKLFINKNFRSAALGYFGHMWELYAFWAFVPAMIEMYNFKNQQELNISYWSFLVIASGALGCIAGGLLSRRVGSKAIAFYSLLISGTFCLLSPLVFHLPGEIFLLIMLAWGLTVVSDSPQFSTLVAESAATGNKGTALTIVTSIGFAITIVSIQILKIVTGNWQQTGFIVLSIGPLLGLIALRKVKIQK